MSLADAIAASLCATNLVLLGDRVQGAPAARPGSDVDRRAGNKTAACPGRYPHPHAVQRPSRSADRLPPGSPHQHGRQVPGPGGTRHAWRHVSGGTPLRVFVAANPARLAPRVRRYATARFCGGEPGTPGATCPAVRHCVRCAILDVFRFPAGARLLRLITAAREVSPFACTSLARRARAKVRPMANHHREGNRRGYSGAAPDTPTTRLRAA